MQNGICKTWTPGAEEYYERLLASCRTFAERHLTTLLRDGLKYDGRSKASKRAMAQARLRLAVASDEDLKELSTLEVLREGERPGEIPGLHRASLVAERLGYLKNVRANIKEKGIKRSDLVCP